MTALGQPHLQPAAPTLMASLGAAARAYRPLPGAADEMLDAGGRLTPAWARFAQALGASGIAALERGFGSAERHIREAGISYRAPGETVERAWPVAHLPILIEAAEWRAIAAGVVQRARLMEALLGEIYSGAAPGEGAPPPAAILGSPNFLRPLVGVRPPGGRHLHLYAADIGRGPDGRWWVLSDRTQAPSGAGYVLENRIVLSRAYPELRERMRVKRLAPFYGAFRDGLAASAERTQPRIGLLTPGPYSATYFEQATLARYLGFPLVEGDDLVARDGEVHVRTISGLKRLDVLCRRVDGDYCDPLALNAASRLGVPGLVEALREGGVVVANMPGSGAVEARALLGFMEAQARRLLGEELALPNIATWWCGEPAARSEALARMDELAFAGAFDTAPARAGASLDEAERAALRARIETRGVDVVAQEVVRLSTTPVWKDGALLARPFVLRVFACATPDGWSVMAGGFARIADNPDARAINMGEGTLSADVWVLADAPVEPVTLLPARGGEKIRRIAGHLPSRAADNLFWLGRYLERAEATARVVKALSLASADARDGGPVDATQARLRALLVAWGAVKPEPAAGLAARALSDREAFGSAAAAIASAARTASSLRDRLAPDAGRLIGELAGLVSLTADEDPLSRAERVIEVLVAIAGLVHENMVRSDAWRFLDMGRRIERAIGTCRYARALAGADAEPGDLDALVDLVDCRVSYRARYLLGPALAPVRDIALLDPGNPRSLAFQVEAVHGHLAALPSLREDGLPETPRRLASALLRTLEEAEAAETGAATILAYEQDLMALADAIGTRYFPQGAAATRPEKLSGLA